MTSRPLRLVGNVHNHTFFDGERYFKVASGASERLTHESEVICHLINAGILPASLDPILIKQGEITVLSLGALDTLPHGDAEVEGRHLGEAVKSLQKFDPIRMTLPIGSADDYRASRERRFPRPYVSSTQVLHTALEALLPEEPIQSRLVLTHGDLNPGNYLTTGEQLVLIDWEFAKLAPPAWDPAVILLNAYNTGRDEAFTVSFIDAYGVLDPAQFDWSLRHVICLSASWAHFKNLTDSTYTQSPQSRFTYWDWYLKNPERALLGYLPL